MAEMKRIQRMQTELNLAQVTAPKVEADVKKRRITCLAELPTPNRKAITNQHLSLTVNNRLKNHITTPTPRSRQSGSPLDSIYAEESETGLKYATPKHKGTIIQMKDTNNQLLVDKKLMFSSKRRLSVNQ